MNETLSCILSRRSIRKYTGNPVPESTVETLLKAAMNAPSACNQQPWHFVLITDKAVLGEISTIHSGFTQLKDASLAILVCGEPGIAILGQYWCYDCAAATQNILLAAHACGLGAVWLGIHPEGGEDSDTISRLIGLPKGIKPFSLIPVGYPAETAKISDRYDKNRVHTGKWA